MAHLDFTCVSYLPLSLNEVPRRLFGRGIECWKQHLPRTEPNLCPSRLRVSPPTRDDNDEIDDDPMPEDTRTKRRKWTKTILYLMGNHLRHCLVEFSASLSLDGAAPVRSTEVGVVDLAMVVLLPRFVARVRIGFTAEKRPPGQAKKQTWLYDCYGLRRHVLDGYYSILSSTGSANPPPPPPTKRT